MSMLAEPRRKQRWTLNPRGREWSEDSNKFGQRMLEKMGWTSGKGLGVNEQGITEHVHVSFKDDTTGIGFKKEDLDKAWTEHQESFNDFLQQLQKNQSDDVIQEEVKSELSGKSLELKSRQSRNRVHYQKFTRGKDVNKYSSKDLANIFGQRDLNTERGSKDKQSNDQEIFDPIGTQENRGGVVTINGGNMADYFMKKGQDFPFAPKNKKRECTNSESEPEYVGFGFASVASKNSLYDSNENKETESTCNYTFENPCIKFDSSENISNSVTVSKSPKKRKVCDSSKLGIKSDFKIFKEETGDRSGCENGFVNAALNLECRTNEICNGKRFEVSRAEFGIANSALDLSDEIDTKKRVTFNDHIEYSTDSVKKKKERVTLDKFEIENKKSKKKRKQVDNSVNNSVSCGFVNKALDTEEISEEMNDNEINEHKSRKSKRRKRNCQINLETIVEIPEEDKETCEDEVESKRLRVEENITNNVVPKENVRKKLKKKKKKECTEEEIVSTSKNSLEEVAGREVATEMKVFGKEECKLRKEEDCEHLSKEQKKKKKKKSELNELKYQSIIYKNTTDSNDIEYMVKEVKMVEEIDDISKKSKKKKGKENVSTNDLNMKVASVKDEKEISDKENENCTYENTSKVEKPKEKQQNLMEESIKNSDSFTCNVEFTKEESLKQTMNATSTEILSKYETGETFNVLSSPQSGKTKISKKLLKSFFHKNTVEYFPGSNIDKIKGYGISDYK